MKQAWLMVYGECEMQQARMLHQPLTIIHFA
jgi:hypothetical protein